MNHNYLTEFIIMPTCLAELTLPITKCPTFRLLTHHIAIALEICSEATELGNS